MWLPALPCCALPCSALLCSQVPHQDLPPKHPLEGKRRCRPCVQPRILGFCLLLAACFQRVPGPVGCPPSSPVPWHLATAALRCAALPAC